MKKIKWYCYLCGKEVGNEFYLWSMSDRTDRVFLCCANKFCIEQLSRECLTQKVRLIKSPN